MQRAGQRRIRQAISSTVHIGAVLLFGSTILLSLLNMPQAVGQGDWLAGCESALVGGQRFGNYAPDFVVTQRFAIVIPPSEVAVALSLDDGYPDRSIADATQQRDESLRMEFYLAGVLQAATAASPDLADGVDYAEWRGSVGTVSLPNGADEAMIAHPRSYAGYPQSNSSNLRGVCLEVNPFPPPTTSTVAPATTVPPATIPPSTGPPTTIPPTSVVAPTTAPPATITATTTVPPTVPQSPITTQPPPATVAPTIPPGSPTSPPTSDPDPTPRIGTPPSSLAYSGTETNSPLVVGWLLVLTGLTLSALTTLRTND